ncbi:hypothetical protein NDU88_005500 [Pleurodeles waltl]|uniref:Uncharacterized protein n=1 Tax=Pleurodeles waltl TaxID=8319 RepID=A0AAV7TAW1_PLEWA|nr:hypothetical protein NDU88_005500 [Pleurodeles waltl]
MKRRAWARAPQRLFVARTTSDPVVFRVARFRGYVQQSGPGMILLMLNKVKPCGNFQSNSDQDDVLRLTEFID